MGEHSTFQTPQSRTASSASASAAAASSDFAAPSITEGILKAAVASHIHMYDSVLLTYRCTTLPPGQSRELRKSVYS